MIAQQRTIGNVIITQCCRPANSIEREFVADLQNSLAPNPLSPITTPYQLLLTAKGRLAKWNDTVSSNRRYRFEMQAILHAETVRIESEDGHRLFITIGFTDKTTNADG